MKPTKRKREALITAQDLGFSGNAEDFWRQRRTPRKSWSMFVPGVRFVQGPLPLDVLAQAYRLHPAALMVLLAIKSEADIQRWRTGEVDPEVVVTSALCVQLGLSRWQRVRGVRLLEAAGLIAAKWAPRCAPRVRLAPGLFDQGKIEV